MYSSVISLAASIALSCRVVNCSAYVEMSFFASLTAFLILSLVSSNALFISTCCSLCSCDGDTLVVFVESCSLLDMLICWQKQYLCLTSVWYCIPWSAGTSTGIRLSDSVKKDKKVG